MIQSLEADVRKHIRVEQQLKLHIEGIEQRVEELENENQKYQIKFESEEKEKELLEEGYKERLQELT